MVIICVTHQKEAFMDKKALVVKSNALIETSYRLSTSEQRIILSCISQIRRDEPITDQIMYSMSAVDFSKICGTNLASSYRDLKSAALKLKRREVRITQESNGKGKKKKTLIAGWVQSIEYSEGEGVVSLRFNHDILPYLAELNECFTSYKLTDVVRMSSTYGVRIYELLIQWEEFGKKKISVAKLREVLQLEDKYLPMNNFKARVLDPAVRDINKNSNLSVEYTQEKTGKKITHLIFNFNLKEKSKGTRKKSHEPKLQGIRKSIIEKNARPGETYEQAALRIKRESTKEPA